MAFQRCDAQTDVISSLSDTPTADGVSAADLKAAFDVAGAEIKSYLNNVLLPQLENQQAAASIGVYGDSKVTFTNVQEGFTKLIALINSIGSTQGIEDGAVTETKIADDAVTKNKIKNNSVDSDKIAAGAVNAAKLAANSVSKTFEIAVNTTWSGAGPYTKTITSGLSDMKASDSPILDVLLDGTNDAEKIEAFSKIYRAVTAAGSITLYATEKPTIAITVRALCIRK